MFAIPGSIYNPNSVGTNNLIKAGARLVTSANDILEELNLLPTLLADKQSAVSPRDEKEAAILQVLSHEPLHIDKIIILTKLDTASISSALAIMELDGKIRNLGGMNYILAS